MIILAAPFIMKNAANHLKKLKLRTKMLQYYWPICGHFQVLKWPILANFCWYFGQFLIFISGNPDKWAFHIIREILTGNKVAKLSNYSFFGFFYLRCDKSFMHAVVLSNLKSPSDIGKRQTPQNLSMSEKML